MRALFSQLFTSIQDKLATIPELKWIDQDLGQLEDYEMRPAVSFPCVLIDFNQTTFDQMQQNRQVANITFTLRLGFPALSHAANVAPQSVKEKALQYYELEQAIYEAIQDFDAGGLMQECTRVNVASERREDNLRVRVMTFTSITEDTSAMPQYSKQPRPPLELLAVNFNPHFDKDSNDFIVNNEGSIARMTVVKDVDGSLRTVLTPVHLSASITFNRKFLVSDGTTALMTVVKDADAVLRIVLTPCASSVSTIDNKEFTLDDGTTALMTVVKDADGSLRISLD